MKRPRLAAPLIRRWGTVPRRTIRLRLTAIYAGLFLACGAALLAINYGLVSGRLTTDYFTKITISAGKEAEVFLQRQGVLSTGGAAVTSPIPEGASGAKGTEAGGGFSGAATPFNGGGPTPDVQLPSRGVVRASAIAASNGVLATLLIESGIALAIMALLAAVLGWVMAGRALRPLRAITAAAREISASSLHRRLALAGPDDELRQLGLTFDALLERLETAFSAQRQFAANVSHELRTPLTYERALIEVALGDPDASNERLRTVLDQLRASGAHQERLIEALLVLSRSQRGLDQHESVDLAAVATAAVDAVDAGGLALEHVLTPAFTNGDPRLIERLAANLLNNAAEHNRPGGHIEVTTRTVEGHAILRVTNSGPKIRADDLDRLFEPFQRLGGARTSTGDGLGLGLGLSIVKAIADAHGATIKTALPDDGGLSIEISFPSAGADRASTQAGSPT
ncbi:MAG TPA: ATP-binding protein [Solirubrobacteraceae bacterium]|jgi:signal transduction histidine kinase|nr:ATP-binding protein [Solirubrobacteraceae bacterium]